MRTFLKLFTVALAILALAFTSPVSEPVSKSVDLKASQIGWKGYKVLGSHTGNIGLKSGQLDFRDEVLIGGNFEIDMNSITCTDLSGGTADKLVGHLKSDDFFGVTKYPVAKFMITNVVPNGVNRYKVSGTLTIKEKSKTVKFIADVKEEAGRSAATASIQVDRSDFDVRFGSGSFFDSLGDKTIYDEFDLEVKLVF
jgi:polyisoprenoid-binding protein YceI